MSDAGREARGVGVNLLTLLAQASLPAFYVVLTNGLGTSAFGLYALAASIVDPLSGITMFGMDLALNRRASVAHTEGDTDRAVAASAGALRVVFTSGVLVTLALVLAAPLVAGWNRSPGLVGPLRAYAAQPIGYHLASIFIVATQAKMVMKYDFWARGLFQPLALLALTSLTLLLGWGATGAAGAVTAGMTLTTVLAAYFYSREYPLGRTLRSAVRDPIDWGLVRMGAPMVLLGLVWNLQGAVDLWALARYRDEAAVGAYKGALIWVVSLSQVRGTFAPVIYATLPPMLERGDTDAIRAFIQRQNRWVAVIAMPLCVLFAGFGEGLLALYGRGFRAGTGALAILALGNLCGALAVPGYVLLLGGHTRYSTLAGASCLAFQLASLPLLVPRYGLAGAALSSALGMLLSQVVQQGFAWRVARVHGFSWGLAKVAIAALSGLALGRLVYAALPPDIRVRFFGGVGVAAVVYLVVLVALGLTAEEREMFAAGVARVRALRSGRRA